MEASTQRRRRPRIRRRGGLSTFLCVVGILLLSQAPVSHSSAPPPSCSSPSVPPSFPSSPSGGGPASSVATAAPSLDDYIHLPPKDPSLYQILAVSPNVTMREICQAYRRIARVSHPDKDKSREAEFKAATEAYRILSSPELRIRYHYYGRLWEEKNPMDPSSSSSSPSSSLLESVLTHHFGGRGFEPFIGRLPTNCLLLQTTALELFDYEGRVAFLSHSLATRLEAYVIGHPQDFTRRCLEEARQLQSESLGNELLETLGYVYERCGRRALEKLRIASPSSSPSLPPSLPLLSSLPLVRKGRQYTHLLGNYLSTASSSVNLLRLSLRVHAPHDPQIFPSLFSTLWRLNKVEIEKTVTIVCKRVLRDPSQTLATLDARARGLLALGQVFSTVARMEGGGGGGGGRREGAGERGAEFPFPCSTSSYFSPWYPSSLSGGAPLRGGGWNGGTGG